MRTRSPIGFRTQSLAFTAACLAPLLAGSLCVAVEPVRFEKRIITAEYHCDGVHFGDIDRDGTVDIVAGPYWYKGPDWVDRQAFFAPQKHDHEASPTNSMFSFIHDFNGDGWLDILVLGRVHKHQAFWYENPQNQPGLWKKNFVFERVQGESPPFVDINHDGKPELLALWEEKWGWIAPDWSQPEQPWSFHPISERGDWNHFYHGTGVGDINNDGRNDVVLNDGWWEQPEITDSGQPWKHHPFQFSSDRGGAQIYVYDVDGDGDSDVVTSLNGHGWGLAWFEQDRQGSRIDFVPHLIMSDRKSESEFGVAFSQPHALAVADVNGDGLLDVVTGKRRWAHGPFKDIEPNADPVLYWFELQRTPGASSGARFIPHLVDAASGVGVQVQAADLNEDGRVDILTASKLGVFAFLQLPADLPSETYDRRKPRLIVTTDIGGDPDDTQSLIRLMTFANEFEIEGLIASASGTPGELKKAIVQPQLIREVVEAYGQVVENLRQHATGYPSAEQLLARIKTGNPNRGRTAIGQGHDSEASKWIIQCADREDDRPLNIAIWGGQTDVAQALWRVRQDRGVEGFKTFVSRIRFHDINDQDRIADWMFEQFPDLFYVLDHAGEGRDKREGAYRGMYLDGDMDLTSEEWVKAHVQHDHGPLGALYPLRTWTAPNPHGVLKEGDTPSWFYFLATGLQDAQHPNWGGWGGRYQRNVQGIWRDAKDEVEAKRSARATVWRWRPAFQAEFQARMDWCVAPFGKANHPPVAVALGDSGTRVLYRNIAPGQTLRLDARGTSDPDQDPLHYRWWIYPEASSVDAQSVQISDANSEVAQLAVPKQTPPGECHVILEVTDTGVPALTRYRRIVVRIEKE